MSEKRVTNAPAPMRAAKGVGTALKDRCYDTPASEADYVRCITGGIARVIDLAGLVVNLSPPESGTTNQVYLHTAQNTGNPLGIALKKLCRGIELKRLPTEEGPFDTTISTYRHVRVSDAVRWLEQEGLMVTECLKDYVARSEPQLTIEDNASTFINATQAVNWIVFGDFDAVNRTLTDAESKKLGMAKSDFVKRAQAGSLNIYGINPNHTGSPTASTIVPREQILTLIWGGNHLIYNGGQWTNLEVEKSKVLELWPDKQSPKKSGTPDMNVIYERAALAVAADRILEDKVSEIPNGLRVSELPANTMSSPVMRPKKSGRKKGDGSFLKKDAPFILAAERECPHDSAKKAAEKMVASYGTHIEGASDESKTVRLRKRISKYRGGKLDLNGFEPFQAI